MQTLVRKKFVLYYSPEFAGGERVQLVEGMDFFTEENGFRPHEIAHLFEMKKTHVLSTGPLQVWRVK